jgi:hypothetical protein
MISASEQGIVYATSWYLDIVSPGWEALVEEDYEAGFPLTARKKAGFDYLCQPPFTQQLGLFNQGPPAGETRLQKFLASIPGKFRLIEIQLNHLNRCNHPEDFTVAPRLTHHLELNLGYEQIKQGYSENIKRNIRKAGNAQWQVTEKVTGKQIIRLFRANRGRGIRTLKNRDYVVLEKLLGEAQERNLLHGKGIFNPSGHLIAGAVFLKSFHAYIFLFSATSREGKETGAMSAVIDAFIRDHHGGKGHLDFEGSMDKSLARFYRGFGSKEVVYLQIRKNKLPPIIRWFK